MKDFHIGLIGMIAGVCTTASFLPQIIKILRTHHARDISLGMYIALATGILLWLVYGILVRRLPIILANSVAVVFCGIIIAAKLVYNGGARK
ncbi:MAG: SemiSWEET transporter [Candidatus Omnitrophica bacterium]|nr:SemiSWEET transporter [Candidatus Omnitrophota bacterium]